MITIEMLPQRVPGLRAADVARWVELSWVRPDGRPGAWLFRDIDVARVRLIVELRDELSLGEDVLPTVLSLLDQLYDARRHMRALRHALAAVSPEAREAVLREVPGRMTDRPGPVLSTRAEADLAARREREAAALRANLRRRKEQQRAQEGGGSPAPPPCPAGPSGLEPDR